MVWDKTCAYLTTGTKCTRLRRALEHSTNCSFTPATNPYYALFLFKKKPYDYESIKLKLSRQVCT